MKNRFFAVLTAVLLCLSLVLPVSAADTHIFDMTKGAIGADSVNALEQQAQKIEDTYGFEVFFAIVDGVGDEGTYGYTESLYQTKAEGENGIALTYNYGDNKYAFYCSGTGETLFPEEVQQNALWSAFAYTETYYDGVYAYLLAVDAILSKAPDVTVNSSESDAEEEITELVPVDRTLPLVVDNADVLTDAEEAALASKLGAIGESNKLEIGVVTVDSYEGKTPEAFADDFYDYNGYGYGENDDGLIVVFNTGEGDGDRNLWISTHGKAIDLVSDFDIDLIIEMMIPDIKNGNFADAFDSFAAECESAVDTSASPLAIPLAILIGFGLAFLIVKIQASKLKTVRQQVNAADYVGEVVLTNRFDNFLYNDVKKTAKAKDDSSSTHTSSSGRTHGGGGKSF